MRVTIKLEGSNRMQTRILFEDKDLMVCHKPAGLATQTQRLGQPDVVSELKNYLKNPYVAVIHRLDQPVEGVLVFAKNQKTAAALTKQVTEHTMHKKYLALICGQPLENPCTLVDYLAKDARTNLSRISTKQDKQAKEAKLTYQKLVQVTPEVALLEIDLYTGRHHQIRVQLSHAGFPLLGDTKYGNTQSLEISQEKGLKAVALCAYSLEFKHPVTGKAMRFTCTEPAAFCKERGFALA